MGGEGGSKAFQRISWNSINFWGNNPTWIIWWDFAQTEIYLRALYGLVQAFRTGHVVSAQAFRTGGVQPDWLTTGVPGILKTACFSLNCYSSSCSWHYTFLARENTNYSERWFNTGHRCVLEGERKVCSSRSSRHGSFELLSLRKGATVQMDGVCC